MEVLTNLMQLFRDKAKTFCLAVRMLDKILALKGERLGLRKAAFVSPDLACRWASMTKIISRKGEMQAHSSSTLTNKIQLVTCKNGAAAAAYKLTRVHRCFSQRMFSRADPFLATRNIFNIAQRSDLELEPCDL